jgi:hypothetical protein
MVTEQRVKRLRQMVDQIQRLPESPDRDRLLNEIRSRAVDVDTGVTPRAILPMKEPVAPWAPRPPKPDLATSIMRLTPVSAASPVKSARPASAAGTAEHRDESFCMDARLSLGDSPLPYVQGRGGRAIAPWTLGLRG